MHDGGLIDEPEAGVVVGLGEEADGAVGEEVVGAVAVAGGVDHAEFVEGVVHVEIIGMVVLGGEEDGAGGLLDGDGADGEGLVIEGALVVEAVEDVAGVVFDVVEGVASGLDEAGGAVGLGVDFDVILEVVGEEDGPFVAGLDAAGVGHVVVCGVEGDGLAELAEVIDGLGLAGFFLRLADGGEDEGDEEHEDADDDEKLDEGEGVYPRGGAAHVHV